MDPTASVLFSHFTSAAIVVWIVQVLKNAKWFPWLKNEGQVTLKRLINIGGALGAHLGINFAWHAGALAPGGGYQFVVTIPPMAVLLPFVWRWAGQAIMQEGWYQVVYNKIAVPGTANPLPAPVVQATVKP